MRKILIASIFFIAIFVLLFGCTQNSDLNNTSSQNNNSNLKENVEGGEKLISVRADYSFCHSTDSYDPTEAFVCEDDLDYSECKKWESDVAGEANTHFYATFNGGKVTAANKQKAWNANEYYMKIDYNGLEETTSERAVFENTTDEFAIYTSGECYPKADFKIYRAGDDLLVGEMSLDNSSN